MWVSDLMTVWDHICQFIEGRYERENTYLSDLNALYKNKTTYSLRTR